MFNFKELMKEKQVVFRMQRLFKYILIVYFARAHITITSNSNNSIANSIKRNKDTSTISIYPSESRELQ